MHLRTPLGLVTITAVLFLCADKPAFGQRGAALVKLTPIVEREVREAQLFVGTVEPSKRATIGSAVDGRVVDFPINEGDRVKEMTPLASLLTETIKLELAAAEAELALRKHELEELQNGSRPSEIKQSLSRLEAARAIANYRAANRRRAETLYKQSGATTAQQVDEAVSTDVAAAKVLEEANAAHDLIVEGPRPERIAQAKARVEIQSAMVEKLRDQIIKHTIITRFAGYVVAEHTELGAWVSRGDPIAEVIALDEVDVEARVVEGQIPFVRIGDTIRVEIVALPGQVFSGNVVSVVPQADTRSRTFPVKIRIKNIIDEKGQPTIKAGMLARAVLPTGEKRTATLVPKDSLVLGGASPMIWTVDVTQAKPQDGVPLVTASAEAIPVRLGVSDGHLIQVIGQIPAGRSVVVLGNERIIPSRGPEPTMVQWMPVQQADSDGKQAN